MFHLPSYEIGLSSPFSSTSEINRRSGTVKTSATSVALRCGIKLSSASAAGPLVCCPVCKNAIQGRTPNSVTARWLGSSQRCSSWKGAGSSSCGRPISSKASRRAVWNGVSPSSSALPEIHQSPRSVLGTLVSHHREETPGPHLLIVSDGEKAAGLVGGEQELIVLERRVKVTLKSPCRSAKRRRSTAARRDSGSDG